MFDNNVTMTKYQIVGFSYSPVFFVDLVVRIVFSEIRLGHNLVGVVLNVLVLFFSCLVFRRWGFWVVFFSILGLLGHLGSFWLLFVPSVGC